MLAQHFLSGSNCRGQTYDDSYTRIFVVHGELYWKYKTEL